MLRCNAALICFFNALDCHVVNQVVLFRHGQLTIINHNGIFRLFKRVFLARSVFLAGFAALLQA